MKYCHNCGTKLKSGKSFCHSCGAKITHTTPKNTAKKDSVAKRDWKKIGIFSSILLSLLIVATLIVAPTKTHFYQVDVPYADIEYYTETEPYSVSEPYTTQEPYQTTEYYTDTIPVQSQQTTSAPEGQYFTDCSNNCYCSEYGGWFYQYCMKCTCTVTTYQQIQKERPVTKYNAITKYETVTKYRDIQKSRPVTKIKQEQRQYEVNWIFGFRTPWFWHVPYLSYQSQNANE